MLTVALGHGAVTCVVAVDKDDAAGVCRVVHLHVDVAEALRDVSSLRDVLRSKTETGRPPRPWAGEENKISSRPGGGHGKPFYVCLRRLGVPPRPPLTEMDRRATVTERYSQQHSGYTRLRPVPRHKCRPGTPGILKYVIRSGSFLRKGIELSNTVS